MSSDEERSSAAGDGEETAPEEVAAAEDTEDASDPTATSGTESTDGSDATDGSDLTDATDATEDADGEDAPDEVAPGEPADEAASEPAAVTAGGDRSSAPRWLLLGTAALAAASFIVAAVFGVMWWVAASDDSADIANARENVVRATGTAVKAFTELDYENPDAYFSRQKEITTGELHKQIGQSEETYRKAIAEAKTKVVSTVQDIAVEELNDHEGKASALATVSNKVTQGETESTKTLRLQVQMTRVDENGEQVWKLSSIGEVPVVGTGQ
ncbi:hypothetical protein [Qaidamihabitans albus]|uniref:hypothetical protein n=1 Tax=Qaidamihabitans albus TaxID=2795733 RepID=UPI001F1C8DCC|nr:hypothetical protein [Qaidamihabitans albus]